MTKNAFINLVVTVVLVIGFMVCTLQANGVPMSEIPMFIGQLFLLTAGTIGAFLVANKVLGLVFTR